MFTSFPPGHSISLDWFRCAGPFPFPPSPWTPADQDSRPRHKPGAHLHSQSRQREWWEITTNLHIKLRQNAIKYLTLFHIFGNSQTGKCRICKIYVKSRFVVKIYPTLLCFGASRERTSGTEGPRVVRVDSLKLFMKKSINELITQTFFFSESVGSL